MGKIFDALEKADNKKVTTQVPVSKTTRRRPPQKREKKVVPLISPRNGLGKGQLDQTLITYHDPQSSEADLFKTLRSKILFPTQGQAPPRSILITSALPDDGKTFISSNLAISIAQGVEEHVLLIDCDIRKPDIDIRFGFPNAPGLSEYLSKGDNITGMLQKTPIEKLTVLPSGKPPSNPAELISSKKMKALLEEVTSRYEDRYIIIDSPPPSMAAETNAIAQYVDGIIIVVKAGKTPRAAIADTIEQIGNEKLLGIVLNQTTQIDTKYYGYSRSYY